MKQFHKFSNADFASPFQPVNGVPLGYYLQSRDDRNLPEITWPQWLPEGCKELILRMLHFNPRERCQIEEVCRCLRDVQCASGKRTDSYLPVAVMIISNLRFFGDLFDKFIPVTTSHNYIRALPLDQL